jgi:hypothetical protein
VISLEEIPVIILYCGLGLGTFGTGTVFYVILKFLFSKSKTRTNTEDDYLKLCLSIGMSLIVISAFLIIISAYFAK